MLPPGSVECLSCLLPRLIVDIDYQAASADCCCCRHVVALARAVLVRALRRRPLCHCHLRWRGCGWLLGLSCPYELCKPVGTPSLTGIRPPRRARRGALRNRRAGTCGFSGLCSARPAGVLVSSCTRTSRLGWSCASLHSFTPSGPLDVRRPWWGCWWALRFRCATTSRLSFLRSPWRCHVLCRSTVRTLESESESHPMEIHGVQPTVSTKLASPADVLPVLLAKPCSAWRARRAGLRSTTRGAAIVRHSNRPLSTTTNTPHSGLYPTRPSS